MLRKWVKQMCYPRLRAQAKHGARNAFPSIYDAGIGHSILTV